MGIEAIERLRHLYIRELHVTFNLFSFHAVLRRKAKTAQDYVSGQYPMKTRKNFFDPSRIKPTVDQTTSGDRVIGMTFREDLL